MAGVQGAGMTQVVPARLEHIPYIDSLRKKNGNELGFIPLDAYLSVASRTGIGGRHRYLYQRLMVSIDNGDLTGFCYSSFNEQVAHIFQIVIQEDARRWERASMLEADVRNEALRQNKSGISCRVAYDIEANFFWRALGYVPMRQVTSTWLNQRESNSKRPLWHYQLDLGLPLFGGLLAVGREVAA